MREAATTARKAAGAHGAAYSALRYGCRHYDGLAAEAVAAADDGIGIPAGADAGSSTGVGGALETTDAAEGSEGSEAEVATALADDVTEAEGAASCGCLEHAASTNNDANDRRNGAGFMGEPFSNPERYSNPSVVQPMSLRRQRI